MSIHLCGSPSKCGAVKIRNLHSLVILVYDVIPVCFRVGIRGCARLAKESDPSEIVARRYSLTQVLAVECRISARHLQYSCISTLSINVDDVETDTQKIKVRLEQQYSDPCVNGGNMDVDESYLILVTKHIRGGNTSEFSYNILLIQQRESSKKQESWPRLDFLFQNGRVLHVTTAEFLNPL